MKNMFARIMSRQIVTITMQSIDDYKTIRYNKNILSHLLLSFY